MNTEFQDLEVPSSANTSVSQQSEMISTLRVCGVLTILYAAFLIFLGLFCFYLAFKPTALPNEILLLVPKLAEFLIIGGTISIVFGVLAIVCGLLAYKAIRYKITICMYIVISGTSLLMFFGVHGIICLIIGIVITRRVARCKPVFKS